MRGYDNEVENKQNNLFHYGGFGFFYSGAGLICLSLNNGSLNILPMLKDYISVLISGSLGETSYGESVVTEVLLRFPRTLILVLLSLAAGSVAGAVTGMLFSYGGSKRKTVQVLVNTIPISLPDVMIILLLQLAMVWLHSLNLPHFPTGGYGQPGHLVLPVISLAIIPAFYLARITYAYSSETYSQKFILTARAKGCSESRVHWVHVWRRIRPQVIDSLYGLLPLLISNLLIVEKMFLYPGLSFNLFRALKAGDLYLFMGLTAAIAAIYSLLILIVWSLRRLDTAHGGGKSL